MKKLRTIDKAPASSIARMLVVRHGALGAVDTFGRARAHAFSALIDCEHNEYEVRYLTEADFDLIERYLYRHIDRVAKFMLVDSVTSS